MSATLQGVHLRIATGSCDDCGVDSTSRVNYDLIYNNASVANYSLASTHVDPAENFERDLNVFQNITKEQLAASDFQIDVIQPHANDHDHYEGDATVYFRMSDGSTETFHFGYFKVGTYHEPHTERRHVVIA